MLQLFILFETALATVSPSQVTTSCNRAGVDCVTGLQSQVNQQTLGNNNNGPPTSNGQPLVFGLDLTSCVQALENRNDGFQTFDNYLIKTQSDIFSLQSILTSVETNSETILSTETNFSTVLMGVGQLMQNATERATALLNWEMSESNVRTQMRDLYNTLEKDILADSAQLLKMDQALRAALNSMQVKHDRAKQVLTQVGNLETNLFRWAFNVTEKINLHNTRVVSLAQELQFRLDEVTSQQIIARTLSDLVTSSKFSSPCSSPFSHNFLR
jgi:hypothetical protein